METIRVTVSRYVTRFGEGALASVEQALRLDRLKFEETLTDAMDFARTERARLSASLAYGQQRVHLGNVLAPPDEEDRGESDMMAYVMPVAGEGLKLGTAWRVHLVETKPLPEQFAGADGLPQVGTILVHRTRPAPAYELVALHVSDPSRESAASNQGRRSEVMAFVQDAEHRNQVLRVFALT
jgi:hypothetical protein